MKKFVLMMASALFAVSASAQTVQESKTFDNFYVGINGGLSTKTTGHKWLSGLNPNVSLRIGRWFTPVFGLAAEGTAYFNSKAWVPEPVRKPHTVVTYSNVSLLGTINVSNWVAGYKGEPRPFEVIAVAGLGWGHAYGPGESLLEKNDQLTSKLGLDFTYNFGSNKAWQLYLEPSINYAVAGTHATGFDDDTEYNLNRSAFQLNLGINYKFGNSNGTHNFVIVTPRDQAEIDALNAQINELRNRKPEVIEKVVEKRVEVPAPAAKTVSVSDLIFVTFAQGKSALTNDAKKALDAVKEGSHVQVVGTASPEGSKEINDRLSQARADVVAKYLKGRGVIVDEATGKGVQGTTSNRLAIVYVK